MSRERHTLDQTLDSIWRRGDRDEMSIKHIGHAIAAIVAFGSWRKAADYAFPIYYGDEGWTELQVKNAYRNLDQSLDTKWQKVERYYQTWGHDKFMEVLRESKFGFYPLSYLGTTWLPYSKAIEQGGMANV